MKQLNLPFEGFYNSSIDAHVNDVLEQEIAYLQDEADDTAENKERLDYLLEWNYSKPAMNAICEAYTEWVSDELGINLTLEEVTSPKFYNFETDRIYVTVNPDDLPELDARLKADLVALSNARYTSHDGFISFVDPNAIVKEFSKPYEEWDTAYLDLVLEVLCMREWGMPGDYTIHTYTMADRWLEDIGYEVLYEAIYANQQ